MDSSSKNKDEATKQPKESKMTEAESEKSYKGLDENRLVGVTALPMVSQEEHDEIQKLREAEKKAEYDRLYK
ncbi:hypothetical protein VTL71DRAFT_10693 [Oculimacula yallundae]|uniref:Uncharacterized protein n=1 Tax=Oculimacula yallundae TaxID=86028 RepID=A0ABR4CWC3_9HELO